MPDRASVAAAVARLDHAAIEGARWFGDKGRRISDVALEEAFVLDEAAPHVLAIVGISLDVGTTPRYTIALTGEPLRVARPGDGTWRALAAAMAGGRTIAAMPATPDEPPTAALVCRPGPAMIADVAAASERDLGADQSNTSLVLDDRLLVKAYRRLIEGLNPDLEMTAFLTEEAGFPAVPPLGGFAEVVSARHGAATVAMAQAFVADGADAYESLAELLVAWVLAPGEVTLEYATEIAADVGTLTAGMHAALADGRGVPDMTPRDATRAEIRSWAARAHERLRTALDVTSGDAGETGDAAAELRRLAPAIEETLTVIDALPGAPTVIRGHGDYHLGQVVIAPDGFRIVDFEGEPLSPIDERRALRHPLRDVASMLRSIDHVARSAGRRAEARNGRLPEQPGLDLAGWRRRARERFLESYQAGLRGSGLATDIDPAILRAFEVEKEAYEFAYAATFLPSWLWAPTEGMRALIDGEP